MTNKLRDKTLPSYGVRIEEMEGLKQSIWKLYEPDFWIKNLKHEIKCWQMKSIEPSKYFKTLKDKKGNALYSRFDAKGVPLYDKNNKKVSWQKRKSLQKEMKFQQMEYEIYQRKLTKNCNFMQDLEKDLTAAQEVYDSYM